MPIPLYPNWLPQSDMENVKAGNDVYIARVIDWYDRNKIKYALLQKSATYWHTAYTHDQTFNDEDISGVYPMNMAMVNRTPRFDSIKDGI